MVKHFSKKMMSFIVFIVVKVVFGTLYPVYASHKAVRTKNDKEYVKWMIYWIVFALLTWAEIFTDELLSWFPFYYDLKTILVIWLVSSDTKGSSSLYREFVDPVLSSREPIIDEYLSRTKEQHVKQVLDLGSKGVNVLKQTAIKELNDAVLTCLLAWLADDNVRVLYENILPQAKPAKSSNANSRIGTAD